MLTICPTPIGNLDDLTPRQRSVLLSADVVACEDTRRTGKLFERAGIDRSDGPRFVSYQEHNETQRADELVELMQRGESVVLVSDAGTPTISDPGFRLVRAARAAGLSVTVLPGPVAAVVALAGSGLPTDRWTFYGFAPTGGVARRRVLAAARETAMTAIFYESPHRVLPMLEDVETVYGPTHGICAARELTKQHEEWLVGPVGEVVSELSSRDVVRGEFVVVVGPAEVEVLDDVDDWIAAMIDAHVKPATIKSIVAEVSGLSKSDVFDRMEALKNRLRT